MSAAMRFVYILHSEASGAYYTGLTCDPHSRLASHNAGRSSHTAKDRPWRLDVIIEFSDEVRACNFERYLKSGSGVAFAQRHLRTNPP